MADKVSLQIPFSSAQPSLHVQIAASGRKRWGSYTPWCPGLPVLQQLLCDACQKLLQPGHFHCQDQAVVAKNLITFNAVAGCKRSLLIFS